MPKWRDADREALEAVTNLLTDAVVRMFAAGTRTHTAAWKRFFADGRRVHRRYSDAERSSITFLKPGNVLRSRLLGDCPVRLLAECARHADGAAVYDSHERRPIVASLVCDSELLGSENVRAYEANWRAYVSGRNAFTALGFFKFADEQDEPLLLLPDYLAGTTLLANGNGVRPPLRLCMADVRGMITSISQARYHATLEDFAEPYPPSVQARAKAL